MPLSKTFLDFMNRYGSGQITDRQLRAFTRDPERVFTPLERNRKLIHLLQKGFVDGDGIGHGDDIIRMLPDGRFLYILEDAGKSCVVLDGQRHKMYDSVSGLSVTPEGRLLYVAGDENRSFVVCGDQEEHGRYRQIWNREFTPDGRLYYLASKPRGRCVLVLNGVEQGEYDHIYDVGVMPGGHLYYHVTKGGKHCVVVGGQEQKWYDRVDYLFLSATGQPCYSATEAGRELAVCDGQEYDKKDDAWRQYCPVRVPARLERRQGDKMRGSMLGRTMEYLVVDGRPQRQYYKVWDCSQTPDGRFCYCASDHTGQFVVLGGQEQKRYHRVKNPSLTSDGCLIYWAVVTTGYEETEKEWEFYVLGDRELRKWRGTVEGGRQLSDGRILYRVQQEGSWFYVVNSEVITSRWDRFIGEPEIVEGSLTFIGRRGRRVYRVTVPI